MYKGQYLKEERYCALEGIFDPVYLKSRRFPAEVMPSHPEGDIVQANQGWHFDEWTDDDGEGLPRV